MFNWTKPLQRIGSMPSAVIVLCLPLLLVTACAPDLTPRQQSERFCAALEQINAGGVNTYGLPEL